jgi:hypothetical protein
MKVTTIMAPLDGPALVQAARLCPPSRSPGDSAWAVRQKRKDG